tara:strand:- start:1248 stop:1490 length:243 start_codon:yes stop_codon:yes gene_type:complete
MKITLRNFLINLIQCYKFLISPIFGNSCRFLPTCSDYSIEALKTFGILKGLFLSLKRILSCHPWGSCGLDPLKKKKIVKK